VSVSLKFVTLPDVPDHDVVEKCARCFTSRLAVFDNAFEGTSLFSKLWETIGRLKNYLSEGGNCEAISDGAE
jgi:hypothetical protein